MISKKQFTAIVEAQWRLTPDSFSLSIDDTHHSKRSQLLQNPKFLHEAIMVSEYFSGIGKDEISSWHELNAFPSKIRPLLSRQYRAEFSLASIVIALIGLKFEYRFKWYEPFEPCFGISRTALEHDFKHLSMVLNC